MFDGEFDIHHGEGGDLAGHPALRVDVEVHFSKVPEGYWQVRRLQVKRLESVDAARGPDQIPV